MAGRRETQSLKPIDHTIGGMAASHRAVAQANTDVAPQVSDLGGRARHGRGEGSRTDRPLAETVRPSDGVAGTAR